MTFIERLKSFIAQQLEGWGPEELISIVAELGVAACVVVPFLAAGLLGRWAIRKYGAPHAAPAIAANLSPHGRRVEAIKHRS